RPAPNPPAARREFGLPPTAHLYLCPQRPLKVHPDLDALLAAILRRDPLGFVILLRGRSGIAADQLAARFRTTLPDVADRVVWLPWQEEAAYHRLLTLADVVLDPLHYGAGSSCYDIFSHDLPLVTLPGPYNASRYAQACYRKMGLPDLVASSPAHYVDLAIRLGTDPDYRRDVTARIAAASPVLFEDMDVVREHEWFFERAVKQAGP
ncbi:MAG TPA: hypothetical protein VG406_00625, partial [Isosphaeraceae bacterium]|nr:hypothetical protein [Isosphaeraceae bacterium]